MPTPLTYKQAGVDIDLGNELVDDYKKIVAATHSPAVLNPLGGFCSMFDLSQYNVKEPVLVSSTDGVGTKLRLALNWENHKGVGIDLVAMCVNDILVIGAKPLFFLDYYASGKLDKAITLDVVQSIAEGCKLAGMALVGGETAEMPGMYHDKDYDLAGFCVGVAEKSALCQGETVEKGDTLIALASSGVHSNGFSLVRRIIANNPSLENSMLDGKSLKDILLTPTRIYSKAMQAISAGGYLKGAAHITGGGLTENIPRFLPNHCAAYLDVESWSLPNIFALLQTQAGLPNSELRTTFNCGVGMVVCVSKDSCEAVLSLLNELGEQAWVIGEIIEKQNEAQVVYSDE